MRTWLIIALLTAVALSGCASEEPSESVDDTAQDDPATSDGGNATVEDDGGAGDVGGHGGDSAGGNETNAAPDVTLTADVINGTAPLLVNFTLDVEDDPDNIAWTFFVDGNETLTGTEVPAAFNHTFDAGSHTVWVHVSNGGSVANETLAIVAEAAAPSPETWHAFRHGCGSGQSFSLDLAVAETDLNSCGGAAPTGAAATYPGVGTSRGFVAGEAVAGQVRAAIWGASQDMSATVVLRADGAEVGSWTTGSASATGHPVGDVPEGRDDIKLTFSGELAADIPADATLELAVTINGSAVTFATTGGDDSTFIVLGS